MQRPPDFDLMRTFVSVTEERSFTKAAQRLNLTQQSISAQIGRLESMVGRRVLDRTPQGVAPTQDGEALLLYARQMLRVSDEIRRHFSPVPLVGSVRMGFLEGFASAGLPFVLGRLREIQPRLEIIAVTGRTESLLPRYQDGGLDLMIGGQQPGDGMGEPLWQEKLVWVGDDTLRNTADPVPLVMLPSPSQLRDVALKGLSEAGFSWTIFFESDNRASLRAAVLAGLGLTVFCQGMMSDMSTLPVVAANHLPDLGQAEFFMLHRQTELVASLATIIRAMAGTLSRLADPVAF